VVSDTSGLGVSRFGRVSRSLAVATSELAVTLDRPLGDRTVDVVSESTGAPIRCAVAPERTDRCRRVTP